MYSEHSQTPKVELSAKTAEGLKMLNFFTKSSLRDAYLGAEYTSHLAINSMIKSKYYKNIKCKMNGCRENMRSVYKNCLIF